MGSRMKGESLFVFDVHNIFVLLWKNFPYCEIFIASFPTVFLCLGGKYASTFYLFTFEVKEI